MLQFNEVRRLFETSDESMHVYELLKGYLSEYSDDVLIVCSTSSVADRVFDEVARDYLEFKIYKARRQIQIAKDNNIYVLPLAYCIDQNHIVGKRFKRIYFAR